MIITLSDARKAIGRTEVLRNVNLTFETGKVYGVIGKNGSGKTMLLRMLAGLISPTSGSISIDGRKVDLRDRVIKTGALIETPSFPKHMTAQRVLTALAHIAGDVSLADIRETIELVGLDPDDRRTFKQFSLGMKQRLGIGAALLGDPQLLLLDEPTNALDTDGMELMARICTTRARTRRITIVASHMVDEVRSVSDHLIEVNAGVCEQTF